MVKMFIMLKCRRLKTCLPYNYVTIIVKLKVLHKFYARVTNLLIGRKMQLKAQLYCNINTHGNQHILKCVPFYLQIACVLSWLHK